MNTKIRKVLSVGVAPHFHDRFGPMLEVAGFDVDILASSESAMAIAQSIAIDIFVFGFPLRNPTTLECLERIRAQDSPCRRSAVLIAASPDVLKEAQEIKDNGYFRVFSTEADAQELQLEVEALTRFAPRLSVRIPIRLEVHLGDEKAMVLSQTENVSACGMLVKVSRPLDETTKLKFDLFVPGVKHPVSGCGTVVRHTFDQWGKVRGIGISFEEFFKDGSTVIRSFLEQQHQ